MLEYWFCVRYTLRDHNALYPVQSFDSRKLNHQNLAQDALINWKVVECSVHAGRL